MVNGLLRYLQLDYVPLPTEERGIPWLVIAVDASNPIERILIQETATFWTKVEDRDSEYLKELLNEWRQIQNKDGDGLLETLSGLVVGPIRAQQTGLCTRDELDALVRDLNE